MSIKSESLDIVESGPGAIEGEPLPDAVRRYGDFRANETMHNLANLPGCISCGVPPVVRPGKPWALVCSWGCGVAVVGTLDHVIRKWSERPTAEELDPPEREV